MAKLETQRGETAEMYFKRQHLLQESPQIDDVELRLPPAPRGRGRGGRRAGNSGSRGSKTPRDSKRVKGKATKRGVSKNGNEETIPVENPITSGPVLMKTFEEPELATPEPIYTGLPLETHPNNKRKKESLWTTKRRPINASDSADESDSEKPLPMEEGYKSKLQTQKLDEISIESDQREALRRRPRRHVDETPKSYVYSNPELDEFLSTGKRQRLGYELRPKRIKVTSPKKIHTTQLIKKEEQTPEKVNRTGTGSRTERNGADKRKRQQEEDIKDNDDYCFTCGGAGVFICCDTCPKLFHFTCCQPPLEECPEESWHCSECSLKLSGQKKAKPAGLFGTLLLKLEGRNPTEFVLPRGIREAFSGVASGPTGEYTDSNMKPELTARQIKERDLQLPGCNVDSSLEVERLYDGDGNAYICHKCGLSGQNKRFLAHCDYCPLVWHIDCVDPPLPKAKTIGSKWRCPNHIEALIVPLVLSRRLANTEVVDVSLYNLYLKIATASNFLIKQLDELFLKEKTTLAEYSEPASRCEISDGTNLGQTVKAEVGTPKFEQSGKIELKKENEEVKEDKKTKKDKTEADTLKLPSSVEPDSKYVYPDYYQNSMFTPRGVTAIPGAPLKRMIMGIDTGEFIYRVPEELVVLDFVEKASQEKTKKRILDSIEYYENQQRLEKNEDESIVVEGLCKVRQSTLFLDELVNIAVGELKLEQAKELSPEEIEDLKKVKKLMEVKGRDAMLEFLQS